MKTGLYIHFPFCRAKCDYCGFHSFPIKDFESDFSDFRDKYIFALMSEIQNQIQQYNIDCIDTIYLGGGTPTIFVGSKLKELLKAIKTMTHVPNDAEISIEVVPNDVLGDTLDTLVQAGINRMILGVQTLNNQLHETIGRSSITCSEKCLDFFCSHEGFEHCVDIIYGIPGQSIEKFMLELDSILEEKPDHISAYMLSVEPNTPLGKRLPVTPAFYELQAEMFEVAEDVFAEHNYIHYEISNYALKGKESRHNMKYWTFQPYLGIGPGAHSFINNERFHNVTPIKDYLNGAKVLYEFDKKSPTSLHTEFIMTSLRLQEGFTDKAFKDIFGVKIPNEVVAALRNQNNLGNLIIEKVKGGWRFYLSRKGFLIADRVIFEVTESLL